MVRYKATATITTQSLNTWQASKMKSVAILAAFVVTLATVHGHDHSIEWTITGEPFEECILPGETLEFIWAGGHNVEEVSAAGYMDCSGITNTEPVAGNYKFFAHNAGTYYFVCGVGGHCKGGNQKAKITVDPSC
eukprot:GFUD01116315.1.p1 GENE.GFUD01116315.1~~GFUD01116315.1.p1  ORF type:complete len:135 (-),score=27.31 GFUD01116315.1:8-412(-)